MGNFCLPIGGGGGGSGGSADSGPRRLRIGTFDIRVIAHRGQGGFADVFEVEDANSGQKYALKVMRCQTSERLEMAKAEIQALQTVRHPNVVRLHGSQVDDITQNVYMLLDWLPHGTLQDMIDKLKEQRKNADEQTVLRIFFGVCQAVQALHSASLAHRDLKPGNVIFAADMRPVLMDLGSVGAARPTIRTRKEAVALQEFCEEACSMLYRAPELFDVEPEAEIDERCDIWSLGGLLYAALFRSSPFEQAYYDGSVKLAVLNGRVQFPEPLLRHYSAEVRELILALLQVDPKQRPRIEQVIERVQRMLSTK